MFDWEHGEDQSKEIIFYLFSKQQPQKTIPTICNESITHGCSACQSSLTILELQSVQFFECFFNFSLVIFNPIATVSFACCAE